MAPKGKKGKKGGDDWDEGLGEAADPIAQAGADAEAADAADDAAEEETGGGGGLMAALKKNKEKRKKKGKNVGAEDLDGEGETVTPTVDESLDLAAKAPEEATMDDEDLFGAPGKKGKGGKGGKQQQAAKDPEPADEEGGGVKTKAQKEKEKKEREKQRKKENVCAMKSLSVLPSHQLIELCRLLSKRSQPQLPHQRRKKMRPRLLKQLLPPPPHPHLRLVVRRRSCLLVSQRFRSSKRSSASDRKRTSGSERKSWLALKRRRD